MTDPGDTFPDPGPGGSPEGRDGDPGGDPGGDPVDGPVGGPGGDPGGGPGGDPERRDLPVPIGTRIALYYILSILVMIGAGVAILLLSGGPQLLREAVAEDADFRLRMAVEMLTAPFIFLSTFAFVRLFDRKPLTAIGFGWPRRPASRRGEQAGETLLPAALSVAAGGQLIAAAAGAAGLLGLWFVIASWLLDIRIADAAGKVAAGPASDLVDPRGLLFLACGFLVIACWQEWMARGYIFSTLREKLAWVHSAGITALLSVLLHWQDSEIAAAGVVNVFLLGMIAGALREMTGSLWTVAVFLGSWNFLLGCVLSLPLSGKLVPRLFQVTIEGSDVWSGGTYGPEGSWLMTGLLVLAVVGLAGRLHEDEEVDGDGDERSGE